MRIAVNDRNSGVTYHRLLTPFKNMPEWMEVEYFRLPQELDGKYFHAVVFNRSFGLNHPTNDLIFMSQLHNNGVKIIMDIDDSWDLPDHHTIRWRTDIDYDRWRQTILDNMFFADLFWVSTEEIKTKIKKLFPNKEVVVVKNTINPQEPMWHVSNQFWKKDPKKVHIGYVGGTTHYKDLDHIKNAVAYINKFFKKDVVWHQCGYDFKTYHGKRVSDQIRYILTSNGKYNNYKPFPGVPIDKYAFFYDGLDISIAPLHNNEFNACKSELKVIEAGQKNCAFIGEDMVTYQRAEEYCAIELASTVDEWKETIIHYIKNRNELEEYKHELHTEVQQYDVFKENVKRIESLIKLFGNDSKGETG